MSSISRKDKKALLRFKEKCDRVRESTEVDIFESEEDQRKRKQKLEADFQSFCEYYFPHYCKYEFAPFHISFANRIKDESFAVFAANWFRGAAKSTVIGLFLPLWLMTIEDDFCMIMVNKSADGAKKLLSELQAELEYNQRYINDYGEQKQYGNWEEGEFVTQSGAAFFAFGRGQSPRGVKNKGLRPTFILGDDLDDDELVKNSKRVRQAYDWLIEAVYGTADMGRTRFGLIGNIIGKDSIMSRFIKDMSGNNMIRFIHSIVNVRGDDGKSTWPAKNTEEDIDRTIHVMGTRRSQKELFNNPIVEGAVFKQEWFQYREQLPWSKYQEVLEYSDPSQKGTKHSDYKAILQLAWDGSKTWITDCYCRKATVSKYATAWYDMNERLPENVTVSRWMEANFAQDMLLDDFMREGKQRGYQLNIRGDKRKKPDKFQRIENTSALFERGLVVVSSHLKENKDWKTAFDQFTMFEEGSRTNDDAPDAFEGGIWKMQRNARRRAHNITIVKRELRNNF